jgi:hypothetical protein
MATPTNANIKIQRRINSYLRDRLMRHGEERSWMLCFARNDGNGIHRFVAGGGPTVQAFPPVGR